MTHNIAREVRDLMQMTVNELRQRYCAVFGEESASHHKEYLWKRIAWRMQVMAEGDISEEARRRARRSGMRRRPACHGAQGLLGRASAAPQAPSDCHRTIGNQIRPAASNRKR